MVRQYHAQSDYLDAILKDLNLFGINGDGGTDKGTDHSYTGMYEEIFTPYFDKPVDLLEIGVYQGGSLALWSKAFGSARITGVDIHDQIKFGAQKYFEDVEIVIGDAYNANTLAGREWDIVIDDGPHTYESFVSCIQVYLPRIRKGGILVIEDIQTRGQLDHLVEFCSDYSVEAVDLRHHKNRHDDLVLIVRK